MFPSSYIRICFIGLLILAFSCSSENDNKKPSIATNTELLRAIRMMDYDRVNSLISIGADVTFRDEFGSDALYYSVVYPRTEIFQLILTKAPKLNSVYEEHKNILHIAIESGLEEKGYFSIIEALINSNVEINLQDDHGNTPLWYACTYYIVNRQTIKLLLEKGPDMYLINKYGRSTYSAAKENNRKELLEILEQYRNKN